jgi:hypothetical protein
MATRIKDLKDFARPVAERLCESGFHMVDLVNAGFVLLKDKSLDEIAKLIRVANGIESESEQSARDEFRQRVVQVLEDLEVYRQEKKPRPRAKPAKSG